MLCPKNIGLDMSPDETCLSKGDVYTILTDKGAQGCKGFLAPMVRGVVTDMVSAILKKIGTSCIPGAFVKNVTLKC